MFSLPQSVGTLDKLSDDLRRSKFDTVALRGVVFIGDREFDLVKPNVLDGLLNLPIYENPPEMAGFLYFAKEDEL